MLMERKKQNNSNITTLQWISEVTGRKKLYVLLLCIIQIALNLGSIGYALVFKGVTDAAVDKQLHTFILWVSAFAGLALFQISMGFLNRFLLEYAGATTENSLKDRLLTNIFSRNYAGVIAIHSGEWLNRMTSDTALVANDFVQIVPGFVGLLVKLIGAMVLLFILCPVFCFIIIPVGIVVGVFGYIFRKPLKQMHRKVQEADGAFRVSIQESLSGLLVIKAFGKESVRIADSSDKMQMHKAMRLKRNRFSNICTMGFNGMMNAAYVLGTAIGGYGIISGTMSYGSLIAIIQLVGQLQAPLSGLTGYFPQYYAMIASAERLMDIEKMDLDMCVDEMRLMSIDNINKLYADSLKRIVFRSASFSYRNGKEEIPVFSNLNITVNKREFIAITGHSGCGKSTLLKLMMNLYDLDVGEILMELENGEIPITAAYRRLFAYVPQGNMLMSGTIGDVVCFQGKRDDDAVCRALEIADADEFVRNLPDGIDTKLGECGAGLSDGQMQRIAIARAIYAESPILMLDESTSALDEIAEKKVLANIKQMTDKTVLIVTHRKTVLDYCDREINFSKDTI